MKLVKKLPAYLDVIAKARTFLARLVDLIAGHLNVGDNSKCAFRLPLT